MRSEIDKIIGQNGNKEFTDLVQVLGCNVGPKFDITKLNYDKIIIASDADIDGLFIRSLLLAFFFKLLPELIIQHKVYIAEPPLYRVNDKKDPFVKNMVDYNSRYVKAVSKDYKIGYMDSKSIDAEMLDKDTLTKFLNETRHYEEDMLTLASHYKCRDRFCNERLLEMILEEFIYVGYDGKLPPSEILKRINIQLLNNRIGEMFNEIYFDDKDNSFKGVIDAQPQYIELSEELIIDSREILDVLKDWVAPREGSLVLKENRTGIEHKVSVLEALTILHKYKPETVHRFKGLNLDLSNLIAGSSR